LPAKGWNRAAAISLTEPYYGSVFGVPPEPWPAIPDGYVFGPEWQPAGVTYVFSEDEALKRAAEHGDLKAQILEHLAGFSRLIDGTATWRVPVRYARAQVVASLTGGEELIHSLAFRPTDESVNVTGQVLHDFAVTLGGYFATWMNRPQVNAKLSPDLTYKQINISYIEQNTGTDKAGKGGDTKTLVPTIAVDMPNGITGQGAGKTLPYEVAMALTLNTDTRGPSTRGRVYLGGLTADLLSAHGLFDTSGALDIGSLFGGDIVKATHDNTTWRMNIVSRRYARGREVQGVSVGAVPDSQRRRRNKLQEAYAQAWGTPAGSIPPAS
jgi:hypothetical protein